MFNILGFCNHTCIQLETIAKAVLNFTNVECPTTSNTDDKKNRGTRPSQWGLALGLDLHPL